jgi:hypothetical protein
VVFLLCIFFINTFWRCHPDLNWGVELLQSSALPLGYGTGWSRTLQQIGASDEARTRYLHLGKVALYQMSYTRRLPGS